jgi:hypothetical protein
MRPGVARDIQTCVASSHPCLDDVHVGFEDVEPAALLYRRRHQAVVLIIPPVQGAHLLEALEKRVGSMTPSPAAHASALGTNAHLALFTPPLALSAMATGVPVALPAQVQTQPAPAPPPAAAAASVTAAQGAGTLANKPDVLDSQLLPLLHDLQRCGPPQRRSSRAL